MKKIIEIIKDLICKTNKGERNQGFVMNNDFIKQSFLE